MATLSEQAWEKVAALPLAEQDAIARQILDELADEERWQEQFARKRQSLAAMTQEALEEDARGERRPLDELL